MSDVVSHFLAPLEYPLFQNQRIYWLYLLTALGIAIVIYIFLKPCSNEGKRLGLFQYLFPKSIYFHKSAIVDYLYFYINALVQILVVFPLFVGTSVAATQLSKSLLDNLHVLENGIFPGNHVVTVISFTLLVALALDLGVFIAHYMQHKISFLWEFHKTHHSASVLTPMTVYRVHPVDNLLTIGFSGVLVGLVNGGYQYLSAGSGELYHVWGVNAVVIVFYLMAYNLRHSHVWFSYGKFLSKWFVSPAMHQIHHSLDERHQDKNIGLMFAFWDRLAGTLYVPEKQETLHFGIKPEDQKKFSNVLNLYLVPFINVFKHIRCWRPSQLRQSGVVVLFLVMVLPAFWLNEVYTAPLSEVSQQVYLEEMTWQEVWSAVEQGKTSVIIPTGGTEQNGPHMVLGKHNYIVTYTAGRIAEKLGNALVAPVMRYVPEGKIQPKEGHMRFAGTLSVPEPVFEAMLENTARSLRAHGFKLICFLGDSFGNQESQKKVAAKLNAEWLKSGVRVLHMDEYYSNNSQVTHLRNQGYDMKAIGGHAGIRDTSELLVVNPSGIRNKLLGDNRNSDFSQVGANGISGWANVEIGQQMLRMKVAAGVSQIKRFTRQPD